MLDKWNPWKATAIVLLLVLATALVTGMVVANWTGGERRTAEPPREMPRETPRAVRTVAQRPVVPVPPPVVTRAAVPTQDVVDACNRYAAAQVGERDKTVETVKDAAVGAVVGAAVGAAGGAIAGSGKGAGKGAGIGGVVGAGAGTLYGLNENKKHDEKYRAAYGNCLRSRGYAG
jgi:hypothetical protein